MNIGLTLGGGGARGLCFIEFCKALDEFGIRPSIISGTSIGAIFGAFYAAGISGHNMEARLRDITLLKIPQLIDFRVFMKTSLLKGRRIEAFFRSVLGCDRFEDLQIPLKITATDFWNRELVVFDSGPLPRAIRASMSLPLIFEPVVLDNRVLVDGGASNPLPHDIIRDECDFLIAIDVSGHLRPTKPGYLPGMFDNIMGVFQTMQRQIITERLNRSFVDLLVRPRLLNFGILDFHKEKEILDSVKHDVEDFKRTLERKLTLLETQKSIYNRQRLPQTVKGDI